MSSWDEESDKVEGQMGQLDLSRQHQEADGQRPEAAQDDLRQPPGSSAGSVEEQGCDLQGHPQGDHHQGHRGGGHRGHTYRRRGRGGGYRGRGRGAGGQHAADETPADSQWNGGERDSSRGKGQSRRFYRGGGGGGARQRTRSEKSSLLDGMREPLPQSERSAALNFEDVEDFWDVVVSGYGPEMTEDDLWDVFGQRDVAEIVQHTTQDMKPYCHIYTTSQSMTSELLKCNRDTFRGHQLHVALSEDMVSRSVSQLLKKKPQKAKAKQRAAPAAPGAAPEQQENEEEPPPAASAAPADDD